MKKFDMDKLIEASVKDMMDAPLPIDTDLAWEDFERRLNEVKAQENKAKKRYIGLLVAAITTLIIILPFTFKATEVTAFKSTLFRWWGTAEEGEGTVIAEKFNTQVSPGKYSNLTLEEAQELTIYHMKQPTYVPDSFSGEPAISVEITVAPAIKSEIKYVDGSDFLIVQQKNRLGDSTLNTHLPSNADKEEVILKDGVTAIYFETENTNTIRWFESSMQYNIITNQLGMEELVKIAKGLK